MNKTKQHVRHRWSCPAEGAPTGSAVISLQYLRFGSLAALWSRGAVEIDRAEPARHHLLAARTQPQRRGVHDRYVDQPEAHATLNHGGEVGATADAVDRHRRLERCRSRASRAVRGIAKALQAAAEGKEEEGRHPAAVGCAVLEPAVHQRECLILPLLGGRGAQLDVHRRLGAHGG
eukprot:3561897-Prymnesium_polylepis.1